MSALGRKHVHQEPRRAQRKGNVIGAFLLSLPASIVLWIIIIAAIYQLATNVPTGWRS